MATVPQNMLYVSFNVFHWWWWFVPAINAVHYLYICRRLMWIIMIRNARLNAKTRWQIRLFLSAFRSPFLHIIITLYLLTILMDTKHLHEQNIHTDSHNKQFFDTSSESQSTNVFISLDKFAPQIESIHVCIFAFTSLYDIVAHNHIWITKQCAMFMLCLEQHSV